MTTGRYLRGVGERARPLASTAALRIGLVVFVLAWILGPGELRAAVPVWVPFLIALGLEVHFFVGGLRREPAEPPDRGPQPIDLERYGEEPWLPEPDRRPLLGFLSGLGLIAVLAVVLWAVETRTGWDALDEDARATAAVLFSEEASRIAEKPVRIRCDETGDFVGAVQHADGVATIGGEVAYLTPERCLDLYRLAFEGEVRGSRTARALAVLAHEAWHLRGVRDEGTTECYALQSGVELGRRLGLSEDTARRLMRQQLVENSLRSGSNPEYLVPADCRDGERLDLDPDDPRFP